MQRLLVTLAILLPLSALAQSQSGSIPVMSGGGVEKVPSSEAKTITSWDDSAVVLREGDKVLISPLAHPERRTKCRVARTSEQEIECRSSANAKTRVFQRHEVAAILSPAARGSGRNWVLGSLGISAGLVAGACLLAPITLGAAIPLAILGGLALLATGAFAYGDDGGRSEEFIYRQSGVEPSAVKLRN